MAGKDIIIMRQKELKRLHVIHRVLSGELRQVEAAEILSLSDRQISRIVKRIREEVDRGIQHKSRGRASSRGLPKKLKDRVVMLYLEQYKGFGPTLTSEKLFERDRINLSKETVRKWLIEAGQCQKGRKPRTYRQWRERKWHCGEMVQIDGSHHDWFAGRRPKCVLMGYIDDVTGRIFCRFYEYEGTIPAMDSFKRYIREHSIPLSVYFDKHTTYKSTAEPSIEDELNGTEPLSEFGRALTELGVKLIHAHSPRAKGRVERMFNTLQDRLVKEMTLAHDGRLYQVQEPVKSKKVLVHERVNGKMLMTHNHISLKFKEITARPEKQQKPFRKLRQRGKDICRQLITHGGNSILRCFTSRPIGLKSCLRLHCENQTFSFCLDILKVYA